MDIFRSFSFRATRALHVVALALFLSASLVLTGCDDDDDDGGMGTMPDQTITELAANNSDLSTLVSALQQAGLADDLEGQGPFTVFAPTNAAFNGIDADELTSDDALLEEVLQYHVVAGQEIASGDIEDGDTVQTLQGETLTFSVDGGTVRVNGATVQTPDVQASNGIVHTIDGVLLETVNTTQRAVLTSQLSTLATAVVEAELDDDLAGDGPFTVFAPLNTAFDDVDVDELTGDDDLLNKVLTHHVVSGQAIASGDISDGQTVETLQGSELTFAVNNGTVTVNGVPVSTTDVRTSNGVVHLIDGVLLDVATVTERAVLTPQLSTLTSAVQSAGLADALNGSGPFTVFAPVNAAFEDIDADELTADNDLLNEVLTYHVVSGQSIAASDITDGQTVETLEGADLTFAVDNGTVTVNGVPVSTADVQTSNGIVHLIDGVLLQSVDAVDRAILEPNFSILADLVGQAGLADALRGPGPDGEDGITVFAPTNDAFLAALDANGNGEIDDGEVPSNAGEILQYHVLDDVFFAADVPTSETPLPTLQGSDVTVVQSGSDVTINPNAEAASVIAPDVTVENGVIHGIDTVLSIPSE